MTVQTREVAGFSAVELRGVGKLRIEIGEAESLTIEADDEMLQTIVTEVIGAKLVIKFDPWAAFKTWVQSKPVTMTLTARELDSVALTGSGSIEASIQSERLEIAIAGSGSVRMGVQVTELSVAVSGAGDVTLAGRADRQDVRISGSGTYDAADVVSDAVSIVIGGAGRVKVHANERLDVQIGGAGTVLYKGSPHVEQRIGGFGKVERMPEVQPTAPSAPPSPGEPSA